MPTLAQNDTDCPRWSHYEGWCEGFEHDCDLDTVGYREPDCDRATCDGKCVRDDHAKINSFIVHTLMPEWEADGWWYEHDDDPPTVPGVERGFLLERDGTRVLVTVALVSASDQPLGADDDG